MRTPLIAGNWKMFKTVHEAVVFVKELRGTLKDVADVEIVVGPPFTALHAAAEAARNSNIFVAAQDMHWEREGAFTGEVSAAMITEAGAEFVIIGHSERRRLFGETDVIVNRKVSAAIAAKLTPIMCVGETLDERERNETLAVLDRQIKDGLDTVTGEQIAELVIAVRARLGDRHRAQRHGRAGRGGARAHQDAPEAVVWRRGGRAMPRDLRRQRQAGQHPPTNRGTRRGRGAGGRRQPGPQELFRHRAGQPARCGIIPSSAEALAPRLARPAKSMILYYSLTTIYVLVCLMLLLVILLQQGKGGDMASAFGGGSSQTAFGARGGATLMTKLTTIFAVLFMVLALALAIIGQRGPGSLVSGTAPPPATKPATPAPGTPAPAAPAGTTTRHRRERPAPAAAPGPETPATTPPAK